MRRKNLIAGSICLAVLPCFALFAVAQQRPAAQQPAAASNLLPASNLPLPSRCSLLTTSQCLLVFRYDMSCRGHSHPLPLAILRSPRRFRVGPTECS